MKNITKILMHLQLCLCVKVFKIITTINIEFSKGLIFAFKATANYIG